MDKISQSPKWRQFTQKLSKSPFIEKVKNNPKYFYLFFVGWLIACLILGIGWASCQPSEYDISLTSASWTETEDFMGIEYEESHFGVLIENSGDDMLYVKIKADYYDKNRELIDTTERNGCACIAPGTRVFCEVSVYNDNTAFVEYSVLEIKKSNYVAVSSGFNNSFDVDFTFDLESNEWTAYNSTNKEMSACVAQFIYYDSAGDIIYVDSFSAYDIPAGSATTQKYIPGKPNSPVDKVDTITYAYYEK